MQVFSFHIATGLAKWFLNLLRKMVVWAHTEGLVLKALVFYNYSEHMLSCNQFLFL